MHVHIVHCASIQYYTVTMYATTGFSSNDAISVSREPLICKCTEPRKSESGAAKAFAAIVNCAKGFAEPDLNVTAVCFLC